MPTKLPSWTRRQNMERQKSFLLIQKHVGSAKSAKTFSRGRSNQIILARTWPTGGMDRWSILISATTTLKPQVIILLQLNASSVSHGNYASIQSSTNCLLLECFTQMIWRESTELGVAIARSQKSKWTYVVARYKPCGNVRGQFTANVPRPKFTKFQLSCLNAHNEYRSLHGVPELVLNEEVKNCHRISLRIMTFHCKKKKKKKTAVRIRPEICWWNCRAGPEGNKSQEGSRSLGPQNTWARRER